MRTDLRPCTSHYEGHKRPQCCTSGFPNHPAHRHGLNATGCRDGEAAGLVEGRELGERKGGEIGAEVGYYAGFCQVPYICSVQSYCTTIQAGSVLVGELGEKLQCSASACCAGVEGGI